MRATYRTITVIYFFQNLGSHSQNLQCGTPSEINDAKKFARDFLKVHVVTMRKTFDASRDALPKSSSRLVRLTFNSCPNSTLSIDLVRPESTEFDDRGISTDSWWVIRCSNLPDRSFRISKGSQSIGELLRRYGFQDSTGCVNHRDVTAHYSTSFTPSELKHVPTELRDANGVPQFYWNSGVCWFNAMCWTSMANRDLKKLITTHISDDSFRHVYGRSIFDRDSAETFRKRLWHEMTVGDDVTQSAELDGQNGFTQFCIMCAQLGVPMYRLRERDGQIKRLDPRVTGPKGNTYTLHAPKSQDDPHILAVRFQDGDHQRFPIVRRLQFRNKRYRLVGLYMGQRKCGHQIGMASPSGHWRDWSIADADLHKVGVGPIFVRFEGDRWRNDWWKAWGELVHVTKFGQNNSEFCSLSPHNPKNDSLDVYRGGTNRGTNSIDLLYTPIN